MTSSDLTLFGDMAEAPALVTIEDCLADQLVGALQVAHLATGPLSLYSTPDAQITLTIGPNIAFLLDPGLTSFFTHDKNPRWYFFSLPISSSTTDDDDGSPSGTTSPTPAGGEASTSAADSATATSPTTSPTRTRHLSNVGSGSYVRITLPEGIEAPGSALEKARDAFEDALISRSFLTGDGTVSPTFSDERGRGHLRRELGSLSLPFKGRAGAQLRIQFHPTHLPITY